MSATEQQELALLQEEVRICQTELDHATALSVSTASITYRRAVLRLHQAQHAVQVAQEQHAELRTHQQILAVGLLCGLCDSGRLVVEPCHRHVKCRDCGGFTAVEQ